jgi:hypothetical protein
MLGPRYPETVHPEGGWIALKFRGLGGENRVKGRVIATMSIRARIVAVALLVLALSALWLPTANAYVDPGSGSFVFQALIGGILAAGFTLKVFWKRLVGLVGRRDRRSGDA